MQTHHILAGTPEWHAHRAQHFNASDAPAMLGCSPFTTRAQLLHKLHTGVAPEVDSGTQRRFDDGHRFEALARPIAEEIIGDDLAPVVGSTGKLSASFDGLTLMADAGWECKSANEELRAALPHDGRDSHMRNAAAGLPKHFRVQLEQQLLVSGAERILFTACKWSDDGELVEERHCWYEPHAELRAEIVRGWAQFEQDLAAYTPPESTPAAVAAPIEALPAISARIEGSLVVHSNLDAFGAKLREFIAGIPAKPTSDQDFADCDAACKALKRAEEALDGAEANALGQVQTVETLTRTIADLRNVARTARLASEKMVKARKEQIRVEEVQRGQKALAEFIASLNATIGKPYMPPVGADFAGVISGKKTLDSLRNAIDTELARAKIEANGVCGRIVANLRTLRELADGFHGLFPDTATLVLKAEDDCRAVIESRIAAHKAEEQRRAEVAAERERDRIRSEEAAKLRAEQEAAEREKARQAAEAAKPAATPAPAPIAAPAVSSKAPAANSPVVVPIRRTSPDEPPMRLGQIGERLGFALTADFLAQLGFQPVATEKAAKLYRAEDFYLICEALVAHVRTAQHKELEAA